MWENVCGNYSSTIQVAINEAASSYRAMKYVLLQFKMKGTNISKDWRIRRKKRNLFSLCLHHFRPSVQTHNDNNKSPNFIEIFKPQFRKSQYNLKYTGVLVSDNGLRAGLTTLIKNPTNQILT